MKSIKAFVVTGFLVFLAACTSTAAMIKQGNDSVTLYNKTVSRLYCPDYDLKEDPTCEGGKISWQTASKLRSQIKTAEIVLDNAYVLELANKPSEAFKEADKASKLLLQISEELRKAQQ